jgi:putative transcriptional regulator
MLYNDPNSYMTGKCLIAMPGIADERFKNAVIFICSHSKDGAMGIIVNHKAYNFTFNDLSKQLSLENKTNEKVIVHSGGPVEKIRGFVLHSTDYVGNGTIMIDKNIAISASVEILSDIAKGNGPKENIIALGYSYWHADQLENEILQNSWLTVPYSKELLFETNIDNKWEKALDLLGIDLSRFSLKPGHA